MKINFKKLVSYYRPYKKMFFLDLLFSFLSASAVLAIPLLVRYLTDNLVSVPKGEATATIIKFSILMIFLLFLKLGCDYFTLYWGHIIGTKMEADMRSEIFVHYQRLSCSFFDECKTGDLLSRVTVDLNNISEFLHHCPEDLFHIVIRIGGVVAIFFIFNMQEALILVLVLLAMATIVGFFMKKASKAFSKNQEKISEINSQLEESISGIRLTKAFANEKNELSKFEHTNKEFVQSQRVTFKMMASAYSSLFFFITALLPIIAISGLFLLYNGQISMGEFLTFLLCESLIVGPILTIITQLEQYEKTMAGYKRFLEILKTKPEIVDAQDAVNLESVQGDIKFRDVSFSYGSGREIFENLNLEIKKGEYIALVGPSGIGKSTLCSLIPRFYEVSSGEILVDGINIKDIKLKNLRENIGFVQQDSFIFSGTVLENIRYGRTNAADQEVIKAAQSAYAHDFIMSFPDGYNTQIGQRGLKLSGGQRQRLAIARVFLKNPPILIFDEATSSLDNESEKFIQKSMEKLAENRTTIVIAHRLSTIKNAKKILVMAGGKIAEEGTHKELLAKDGAYAQLYRLL